MMKIFTRFVTLVSLTAAVLGAEPPAAIAAKRLDRWDLLAYRADTGEIRHASSVAEWEKRRAEILHGMQEVMGPLPAHRTLLHPEVREETDCGKYVRLLVIYDPEPRSLVPAYLLIPKQALAGGDKQFPAVLCLHPTDDRYGHKGIVGLGTNTTPAYARELAERGFVTFAPAYPLLANYQPDLKALGYVSGTMKAIWDNIRALDYLESLPFVQRGRFGAIGHSLGGHNAIFTAVFDARIRVIVSSCGFDSFSDYRSGDIRGWTRARYMPKLLQYLPAEVPFDFPELIGALAPRVCFVSAPFYDDNFQWRSVYRIEQAAERVYRLYHAENNLKVVHPSTAHLFSAEIRAQAYAVLEQVEHAIAE